MATSNLNIDANEGEGGDQNHNLVTPSPQASATAGTRGVFTPTSGRAEAAATAAQVFNSPASAAAAVATYASPPQTIKYEEAKVSPTNLVSENTALEKFREDRIRELAFYTEADNTTKNMIDQCLLYLYGHRFYWEKKEHGSAYREGISREARIQIISNFFATQQNTRLRLRRNLGTRI